MDNLLSLFKDALNRMGLTPGDRLLVAVSGGMDSVVLTKLCLLAGLDFSIAHVNFQLRGEESKRDELFVQELAKSCNKFFFTEAFDTLRYAETHKCSVQVAARELRYNWFKALTGRDHEKFKYLLTAHHLDDSIETMLMHFFRGTGITGLTGIPERNDYIVRPLLNFSKNQLKTFAVTHQLAWVEDSSNDKDDYTRNYFRNQLIPSLQEIFPNLRQNLAGNLERFSDTLLVYREAVNRYKNKLVMKQGPEYHIPVLMLKKTPGLKTVLFEILKDYDFTPAQAEESIGLLDSANGKYVAGISHRIIKNRKWLIIAPLGHSDSTQVIIEKDETLVEYEGGRIYFKQIKKDGSFDPASDKEVECLDLGKIKFPLILRNWKTGDYFYPLGMNKKKKLARFFIDQKLSRTAKEKVRVLVSEDRIVWVVGYRIDHRFRVLPGTKNLWILRVEKIEAQ
jgi:tRNA(Ile)-lysidine synthase